LQEPVLAHRALGHLRQIGLTPQVGAARGPQKPWQVSNRGMRYRMAHRNLDRSIFPQ
jgi:hypothetical protein